MPSPTITFAIEPSSSLLSAKAADRASRQWLEQAGLVRDDATGLHRPRRATSSSVAPRLVLDATRLLTAAGYDVLRLYGEDEQQQAVTGPAIDVAPLTRAPGTIWVHQVAADVAAGRLVVHARLTEAAGPTRLLASYPADGTAAVLTTDGGRFYDVATFGDLDAAALAFGHPATLPAPTPEAPRTDAATARSAAVLQPRRDDLPAEAPAPGPAPRAARLRP
ncbi:hypothetical protein [Kitasatospora sp. A2-31]|uniref:hypothetical protein n=1 Tax=Kitasatospora sp. A2-31 TaxID=2916414 RepID=UPI001EEABB73|nr:hypothetical protein [Kitasatospora sp. A2-31]MCG6496985.1 hypothetical protein [Kitasatospora sp. A2-31]